MGDSTGGIDSFSGIPANMRGWQPTRTTGKTTDRTRSSQPSADGPLGMSREVVEQALTDAGFLGFNVPTREALRRFAQRSGGGSTADVNRLIDCVRAALRKHGYYNLTSSGEDKITVFVEPNNGQTSEGDAAIYPAVVEAARQVAAQTASQIEQQPQAAEETQAGVSGNVAARLLA